MEALQMLKFNFKKTRLNFMSEWQCVPIPDAEEDWLRKLGTETDAEQQNLHREICLRDSTSERLRIVGLE
jgi:hypothetical protein